ncbi:MAG: glycosyltransferase [Candidatus Methanoplasma sp.]|jgi:glycosyltransferase involved in cell wall biosynthesis|nr:glycosyltransferase [Candidatus Methanoplasma sp.]
MRELTLLRRPPADTAAVIGIKNYTDGIEACLKKEGIRFDVTPVDMNLGGGYFNLITNGFLRPLRSVLKVRSKDRIFHAADELCGIFFPLIRGKKILTVHHVIKKGEYRGSLYYMFWKTVTAVAIKSSDRVIAISDPTREDVIRTFKADPDKVVSVTSNISRRFRIVEDVEKEKTIGCMGTLIPRKNMSSSITAFRMLTDRPGMSEYVLEICGEGPEKERLLRLAEESGVGGRVRFVSGLSDSDIITFYNRSALVFNTSLREGMGMITIEAQRCGTPVLHLERAEIPREVTRFSVPCADEAEMAERAYGLLTDRAEYERVSRTSKEYADTFGNDSCRLYLELLKGLG